MVASGKSGKSGFCLVCLCLHASVCASQNIVNTINILQNVLHIFTKLTSTMHYETEMNVTQFVVKRSKFKVTME